MLKPFLLLEVAVMTWSCWLAHKPVSPAKL
jgi:hypothetical protein